MTYAMGLNISSSPRVKTAKIFFFANYAMVLEYHVKLLEQNSREEQSFFCDVGRAYVLNHCLKEENISMSFNKLCDGF
mgnify:CR=1 FL=1